MKILSSDKKVHRLALDAALLGLTLILAFVEVLVPVTAWIPLPGFKLGLSNIGILTAAYICSPSDAALVSLGKVVITALLFGNVTSFIFSASGAAAVLILLFLLRALPILERPFGFVGISVLCAVFHNMGQLGSAAFVMSTTAVFSYVPLLLAASCLYGTVNGLILNFIFQRRLKL
ncbi:MAG: Gx transporter family protein [Ruminococcaceae bacterium]|nr:Gx transporter family protein [Oscillospiraceae bacterium]